MPHLPQLLLDAHAAGWGQWVRTGADEQAVLDGCRFDLAAAERVRTFFTKFLRHSKGQWAGKQFVLLDWQWEQIVAPLFGWKRAEAPGAFAEATSRCLRRTARARCSRA